MISIRHLKKSFGRLTVLDDVSIDIDGGGIMAILGPNGSGKTTLLKVMLGMVIPDGGSIFFNGAPIEGSFGYRRSIGYLPQIARFPDNLSVREIIAMVKDIRGETATPEPLIALFGLETSLDKKLGNLSGGTRQKVNIVLTFMFDTPVIILDEPTAGLDPVSLIKLKKLLVDARDKGKRILITSHVLSFVEELADEVVFLLEGRIYFKGTLKELRAKTSTQDLEHSIAAILEP